MPTTSQPSADAGRGKLSDFELIQRLANPTARDLADRLEAWVHGGGYRPGDVVPGSLQASIGSLVCSHLPLILAALRASTTTPAADPGDAADAGR